MPQQQGRGLPQPRALRRGALGRHAMPKTSRRAVLARPRRHLRRAHLCQGIRQAGVRADGSEEPEAGQA